MPILTLQQRVKEVGRIRIGQKGPKGQPQKLTVFRFTSFDKRAIEKIAELYGGTARPCTDKDLEGQTEVVTETSEMPFIVSPIPPSQFMEQWSGGGCVRRCDGQTELLSGSPCTCTPGEEDCKPTTRLSLVLPDVPGIGVWRIETHGWNAAVELIPTFEFLQKISGPGRPATGLLAIEERKGKVDGKTTRFMVPVIRTPFTPRQLLEASAQGFPEPTQTQTPQLPPQQTQELPAPSQPVHETSTHVVKGPNPRGAVFALLHDMNLPPHEDEFKVMYYIVFGAYLQRGLTSLSGVSDEEWQRLAGWLRLVQSGEKTMPKQFSDYLNDPFRDASPHVEDTQTEEAPA